MQFDIYDNASPMIQALIKAKPDIVRGATKSTGYWMKTEIQKGILSGAPGGQKYAEFLNPTLRRALDRVTMRRGKTNYKPFGKLERAIKYQPISSNTRGYAVVVGWTNNSAIRIAELLQRGFTRPMTPQLRRVYDAAYAKLGWSRRIAASTTQIKTPARDTIRPMKRVLEPQVGAKFAAIFLQYIRNGPSFTRSGKGRTYRVIRAL